MSRRGGLGPLAENLHHAGFVKNGGEVTPAIVPRGVWTYGEGNALISAQSCGASGERRMNISLFDARVLEPLVEFLDRHGAGAESFLDRARIPGELVAQGGWITKKQAYDLTYDIVQRTHCPDAVFAAYLNFELHHIGPIAEAMRSCKTVKESLEVATRLGGVAYEGNEYFLRIDGDTTWFCYREPNAISAGQPFITDMTLTVYYRMLRIVADEDWHPEQILTQGEVFDRHRKVEHFEDCRASFHPNLSALAFPTKFLSRRVPWRQEAADFDVSRAWLSGPDGSEPIVDTLYRLLASCFPYRNLPTLDQLSRLAGVSAATLKRQLAAAGMTYRRLLDRLRFDAACDRLSIPQLTIKEIAHELGYSGTNNFARSFHRMTGVSPAKYRRQHQAKS
jgi:AraC-like DNA-binding protein